MLCFFKFKKKKLNHINIIFYFSRGFPAIIVIFIFLKKLELVYTVDVILIKFILLKIKIDGMCLLIIFDNVIQRIHTLILSVS